MSFKIDENLHEEVVELLRQHGHDAVRVFDQHLQGHTAAGVRITARHGPGSVGSCAPAR